MSKASSLVQRVRTANRKYAPQAKLWTFVLDEGKELTPEQREKIGPNDTIVIRYCPANYLGLH